MHTSPPSLLATNSTVYQELATLTNITDDNYSYKFLLPVLEDDTAYFLRARLISAEGVVMKENIRAFKTFARATPPFPPPPAFPLPLISCACSLP